MSERTIERLDREPRSSEPDPRWQELSNKRLERLRTDVDSLRGPLGLTRGYMPGYPQEWLQLFDMYGSTDHLLDPEKIQVIVFGASRVGMLPRVAQLKRQTYSPLGVALAVQTYRSLVDLVLEFPPIDGPAIRSLIAPDEEVRITAFLDRFTALDGLLNRGERSINKQGWKLDRTHRLESVPRTRARSIDGEHPGGRPSKFIHQLTGHLWTYMQPIYRRAFTDDDYNTKDLRKQIALLLSPFFVKKDLLTTRGSSISNAINYAYEHPNKFRRSE